MFLSKRLIGKSVIAGALIAALGTGTAFAQSYPNKTITLVAPYAVGGDSDFSGRNLSVIASKLIGQ